ncbi:MAG: ThiF family adenylyltransferase [Beijerinckiaceae bacterium]
MSAPLFSAALSESLHAAARAHLLREDGQEDLCFALWRPSRGAKRFTALVRALVMPMEGERDVHGNASFQPAFLERAISLAQSADCGLALLHSHPLGRGWQGMSKDDIETESGRAAAVLAATGLPFLGLTLAGLDECWSARFWERVAPRSYERRECASVRVVGERLRVCYNDAILPPPDANEQQIRTVSAWGEADQANLVRLRVGLVGAGSVGGFIAESLARAGFTNIPILDFDKIEKKNLDRLCYATRDDIGKKKAERLADRLREIATADRIEAIAIDAAVFEEEGWRAALDCDILVSCVDRPWGRHAMNLMAYAHLIPVVDGGISVRVNRRGKLAAADWRAHVATPGRPCLQCLGQYDPAHVQLERTGQLDDPVYIAGLDPSHLLRAGQNVSAFSMACASQQLLQLLALVLAPLDQSNPGAQIYHFVGHQLDRDPIIECGPDCFFPPLIADGDRCPFPATGIRCERVDAQIASGPE